MDPAIVPQSFWSYRPPCMDGDALLWSLWSYRPPCMDSDALLWSLLSYWLPCMDPASLPVVPPVPQPTMREPPQPWGLCSTSPVGSLQLCVTQVCVTPTQATRNTHEQGNQARVSPREQLALPGLS